MDKRFGFDRSNNLVGKRFGMLLVVAKTGTTSPNANGSREIIWRCCCDCGKEKLIRTGPLTRKMGGSKSCGCKSRVAIGNKMRTHGMAAKCPEYFAWQAMKARCLNPNNPRYPQYGGRGIGVCAEWQSFEGFFADMGKRPSRLHSVGRINNDGDYCAANCRWEIRDEQDNNRTNSHRITINGVTKTLTQWCRDYGIKHSTVRHRLENGWSIEESLTTPSKPRR